MAKVIEFYVPKNFRKALRWAPALQRGVAAVTSTTSTQLTRLKAIDCAFSRKVHHA
jgi:hypothetical protein